MVSAFVFLMALAVPAQHDHLRKSCAGTLTVTDGGVQFEGPKHKYAWTFDDVQRLVVADDSVQVRTYEDRRWKLGADREERFVLEKGKGLEVYALVRERMDQRLVAALAVAVEGGWTVPAKLRHGTFGSQGELSVGEESIVYKAPKEGESRTWPLTVVESVASGGEFELTVTTMEGSFEFQLKRPMPKERYQALWLRLERGKGLKVLSDYMEVKK